MPRTCTDHICSNFRTEALAADAAMAWLADEEPGCYFEIRPMRDGAYFTVELFEADGYRIGSI